MLKQGSYLLDIIKELPFSRLWQTIITSFIIFITLLLLVTLMSDIPKKQALSYFSGNLVTINDTFARIQTKQGMKVLTYDCICDDSFTKQEIVQGSYVTGLAEIDEGVYRVWQLKIDKQNIFTYPQQRLKKQRQQTYTKQWLMISLLFFWVLFLSFAFIRFFSKKKIITKTFLCGLLEELADKSTPDQQRFSHLAKILTYNSVEFIERLSVIAMDESNSHDFLHTIGKHLGYIWSTMDIEQIQAIKDIHPIAKMAAVQVLTIANRELATALETKE